MSIASMKKRKATDIDSLNEKIATVMNPFKSEADERFWQPSVDKAGNGYAVIRFLPNASEREDALPFVRVYDHGFKGPGGWYIENSRTSIVNANKEPEPDPVTEWNSELWNSGNEADKDIVRGKGDTAGTKRRLHFYSNVLVLEDPGRPENVGKVFIYKYGKKIHEKIDLQMKPKFADQKKVNPFDPMKAPTFTLRIQKVDGQRNYNESTFATEVTALDKKYDSLDPYNLDEFTDPSKFKSYDELKAKLSRVLGKNRKPVVQTAEQDEVPQNFNNKSTGKKASAPVDDETLPFDVEEGGEDELEKFRKMASE